MDYYKLLNLTREPFSNSPDPDLFFRSSKHADCLHNIEIALRLHRGLCVVCGEVGTGKTTICRHLLQSTVDDDSLEMHLILDPSFNDELEMLSTINSMFNGPGEAGQCQNAGQHKEMIKDYLFLQGVDRQKTIALLLDEGQKLTSTGAEILRELLNFETNSQKLVQILIFAQREIDQLLEQMPNFADRISLYHQLLPLSRKDTDLFIRYRLDRSCASDPEQKKVVFTRRALRLVHTMTGGYPRKIINLGHNILLTLIIKGTHKVTPAVVRHAARNLQALHCPLPWTRLFWCAGGMVILALLWTFNAIYTNSAFMDPTVFESLNRSTSEQSLSSTPPPDQEHNSQPAVLQPIQKKIHTSPLAKRSPEGAHAQGEPQNLPPTEFTPTPSPIDDQNPSLPQLLGSVHVNRNENLWNIAQGIYGTSSEDLLQELIQANPEIENPDIIHQGQQIHIPATGFEPAKENQQYWIVTSTHTKLDEAYDAMLDGPDRLRVLCTWDSKNGLQYHVVVKTPFRQSKQAKKTMQDVEYNIFAGAQVLDANNMYIGNIAQDIE
ncbi:AAA family ATPase [Desulfohalobium retbaense]|uniref:Peptidoglycan-binding lysin domain protein n=1 Tax=Desulfohalobium retbaense (strain ATCC 49708 / DSM 5692 / JCM 16813 / HR100) TaxID=485915 RepID=C8X4Q6_DESRD|nr:AAA family ATPase [Desulfohalobium retbaense]ACV69279.1 Peptidoglycan-binding lysin domain protein [Desulfohalobium retbaense DSM 5692]